MLETIENVVTAIDDAIWGWWLIILLLGTHVFMTFKTGFIQWKSITKGIKLSVSRDPDAEGEVSNLGALTTALAATIGTGNYCGRGHGRSAGRPGSSVLVLAFRCLWHCDQICGVFDRRKIQS